VRRRDQTTIQSRPEIGGRAKDRPMGKILTNQGNGSDITASLPPHNPEAERSVLGLLLRQDVSFADVDDELSSADFYVRSHGDVFTAIQSLTDAGKRPEPGLVAEWLMSHRGSNSPVDLSQIRQLQEDAGSPASVDDHIGIIRDAAMRRRLHDRAVDLQRNARDPKIPLAVLEADADLSEAFDIPTDKRFEFLSGPQLFEGNFSQKWLIDDVLVAGQPCGILGGFKCLKTLLTLDLLLSLASGGKFLGRFKVNAPCRVAFMSGESGFATLQDGAVRICRAARISPPENFRITTDLPRLGDVGDVRAIRRIIEADRLDVLAIDPFYLAADLGDDSSNVYKVGKFLKPLAEISRATGCTLIIVHHNRKHAAQDGQPADLSDSAGAGFAEFVRQWLILSRREKYDVGTGEHRLWLNVGGSAGHSGLYGVDVSEGRLSDPGGRVWNVTVQDGTTVRRAIEQQRESATTTRKQEQLNADCETILKVISRFPDGETKTEIRKASELSAPRFDSAFTAILDAGQIEYGERIRKGNNQSYPAYRLTGQQRTATDRTDADGCTSTTADSPPIGGVRCVAVPSSGLGDGDSENLSDAQIDEQMDLAREAFPS
jgi:hypothetical protein